MPQPTTPPETSKREAIIEAALELFSEHTFEGARVPLIAERAGVGAGTIYRYFDSKEALVNAVYRHWKRELVTTLLAEVDDTTPPRALVTAFWRAMWRFATEHPRAFSFLETHHHASYLDDESRAVGASVGAAIGQHIVRAQRQGALRDIEPGMLMALVFGAFTGIVKASGDAGLPQDPALIDSTAAAAWAMVARPEHTHAEQI